MAFMLKLSPEHYASSDPRGHLGHLGPLCHKLLGGTSLLASGAHSSAIVHGSGLFKVSMSGQVKIRLQDFASGGVKDIDFEGGTSGLPENIGKLFEAFADGEGYPDWKWAVKRHAYVDALYESHDGGKRASYTGF
ncbi:hypothetical protein CERZMDRAFT_96087 [Cercospora zeae-maydis SCOH1-5]|uniref:Uncharacterized protein n=1 Tax=Cercospora zeae-maydis SCOH1-5 TaxID=717836 RepID=A0A6A6FKU0_9PEZI|nr:hypothetical protein CERZMDRAFT_96087 [Cercospora zeae-maydis SCOH1-5]